MRALYFTTASIFSCDYRPYGFLETADGRWQRSDIAAEPLLMDCSPHGLQPGQGLGDTDPRLSEGPRLAVLIERSHDQRAWCLAATVAGLPSSWRRDFNGRRIRDGLHLMACGSQAEPGRLQEAVQALRSLCRLAIDPSHSLDHWCSRQAFEQDEIPFPAPQQLWQCLATSGQGALADPGGARPQADLKSPRSRPVRERQRGWHRLVERLLIQCQLGQMLRALIQSLMASADLDSSRGGGPQPRPAWPQSGSWPQGSPEAGLVSLREAMACLERALQQLLAGELTEELVLLQLGERPEPPPLRFRGDQPRRLQVMQASLQTAPR